MAPNMAAARSALRAFGGRGGPCVVGARPLHALAVAGGWVVPVLLVALAIVAVIGVMALMGTTLASGPVSAAAPDGSCILPRTEAHHSEGLDTWHPAYPRPHGTLDAVMVFLSFPDVRPAAAPRRLAADYFPGTTRFFERASYGRFTLRPHPVPHWVEMPAESPV